MCSYASAVTENEQGVYHFIKSHQHACLYHSYRFTVHSYKVTPTHFSELMYVQQDAY